MSCEDQAVEQMPDGRWRKCFAGTWVLLPGNPVAPGTTLGATITVLGRADLDRAEITKAIDDPKKQVVVQIIELEQDG